MMSVCFEASFSKSAYMHSKMSVCLEASSVVDAYMHSCVIKEGMWLTCMFTMIALYLSH